MPITGPCRFRFSDNFALHHGVCRLARHGQGPSAIHAPRAFIETNGESWLIRGRLARGMCLWINPHLDWIRTMGVDFTVSKHNHYTRSLVFQSVVMMDLEIRLAA